LIVEKVGFIVKWNPRGTDLPARASEVFAQGKMIKQDKKGRIAIMTETVERTYKKTRTTKKRPSSCAGYCGRSETLIGMGTVCSFPMMKSKPGGPTSPSPKTR
jgi:hypothetical protein